MRTNPEAQHFCSVAPSSGKQRQYRRSNSAGLTTTNQGQSECRELPIFSTQLVSTELKDAQQRFNGVAYVEKRCKALYCKVAQTVKFSDLSRFGIFLSAIRTFVALTRACKLGHVTMGTEKIHTKNRVNQFIDEFS